MMIGYKFSESLTSYRWACVSISLSPNYCVCRNAGVVSFIGQCYVGRVQYRSKRRNFLIYRCTIVARYFIAAKPPRNIGVRITLGWAGDGGRFSSPDSKWCSWDANIVHGNLKNVVFRNKVEVENDNQSLLDSHTKPNWRSQTASFHWVARKFMQFSPVTPLGSSLLRVKILQRSSPSSE